MTTGTLLRTAQSIVGFGDSELQRKVKVHVSGCADMPFKLSYAFVVFLFQCGHSRVRGAVGHLLFLTSFLHGPYKSQENYNRMKQAAHDMFEGLSSNHEAVAKFLSDLRKDLLLRHDASCLEVWETLQVQSVWFKKPIYDRGLASQNIWMNVCSLLYSESPCSSCVSA
jgi:hypothetical protein